MPDGVDPPASIPPEVFAAATRAYATEKRVDMRALADAANGTSDLSGWVCLAWSP